MKTISLCMIVKNEEAVLERCLKFASCFADEIIILDTGSVDSTKEIAKRYTDNVYDYLWQDDFSAARNASYSYASKDYIMFLDADDVIEPDGITAICNLKKTLTDDVDVVTFVYTGDIHEQVIRGNDFVLRDRLIKRSLNAKWHYPIHEAIPLLAEYKILNAENIAVIHRKKIVNDPARNMRIFDSMKSKNIPMSVFNRYFYCRELYYKKLYDECINEYQILKRRGKTNYILNALPFAVWSFYEKKDTDSACKELLEILNISPPCEFVYCELGNCFFQKADYTAAESWYLKALSVCVDLKDFRPHFLAYQKFLPYLKLGMLYAKQGNFKKALECNGLAAEVFPDNLLLKCNQLYYLKNTLS